MGDAQAVPRGWKTRYGQIVLRDLNPRRLDPTGVGADAETGAEEACPRREKAAAGETGARFRTSLARSLRRHGDNYSRKCPS